MSGMIIGKAEPPPRQAETAAASAARVAYEAAELARARGSVATEGSIPIGEMLEWADSLDTEHRLNLPLPRKK